mmetsp:Transcript_4657/g.11291  ORF Transcript_4657/g.11291 Transcript_4657/m.11291 type:complete len:345 (+) Transcript_4657:74-1108(+)
MPTNMVATRRSSTALERVAVGGAVMFGAAWQLSNCFLPSAAAPNSVPLRASTSLRGGSLPQTSNVAQETESASVLCMAAGLVGLSTAALHPSRNMQKRGQRDMVQRGIFKKIFEKFGSKPGDLRDGWQKLADSAKKSAASGVKSNNMGKGQAKKAIAKKGEDVSKIEAAPVPAAAPVPLDYTLRDGWQALSDRAAAVYTKDLGSADVVAALKKAAPAAAVTTTETTEAEKKEFDVWNPDTYGSLTMEDVQKYGTAGTIAYVLTELLFWAIALPNEVFLFYKTAGRWPDFDIDADKAAVFGFVFAASNIARALLPLRFGAALAIAPWVDENIVNPGQKTTKKTTP